MFALHTVVSSVTSRTPLVAAATANPLATAIGAVAVVVGLAFLARGVAGARDAAQILRSTATDPAGLDGDERRVRVTGRAAAVDDDTLPAPFGGDPCLCAAYDVSEYRSQGKGQAWVSIDAGEAGVPFRVDDGGTGVRVDPAAATFSFDVDAEVKVDADERPPERVRQFVDTVDDVDATETGYEVGPITIGDDPRRRYRQRVLRPGESVTVVGDSEAFPGAPVGEVKARIGGGDPFVVSDADARRTALRQVGGAAVPVVLAAVSFAVAGVALSPVLTAVA